MVGGRELVSAVRGLTMKVLVSVPSVSRASRSLRKANRCSYVLSACRLRLCSSVGRGNHSRRRQCDRSCDRCHCCCCFSLVTSTSCETCWTPARLRMSRSGGTKGCRGNAASWALQEARGARLTLCHHDSLSFKEMSQPAPILHRDINMAFTLVEMSFFSVLPPDSNGTRRKW